MNANVPWIEIIKSYDLQTSDGKPIYIRRGTLSGTVYGYVDKQGKENTYFCPSSKRMFY